jgi:hypothetical protein
MQSRLLLCVVFLLIVSVSAWLVLGRQSANNLGSPISINGYSGTIDRTWNITSADAADHAGFETKVVADRAEALYAAATKYPDLTRVVINEVFAGPGGPYKDSVTFNKLESIRRFRDAATARSAARLAYEDEPQGQLFPSWVYLTREQREQERLQQEVAQQRTEQIKEEEHEHQQKAAEREQEALVQAQAAKDEKQKQEELGLSRLARDRHAAVQAQNGSNAPELDELSKMAQARHRD